ncbi:hypothetical protein BI364_15275 [Acidihalobacter yilgarnensis]|uniref:Transmembrane protein n=1 Tax=Acidihalobacter yilgarnensis TaxID=2819280 RepID=A0A1D8IRF2_9GAMM|nr:hypothetical protein [Acidihalobacter yilgarnensis]AOU99118.1 hypothetical protein BI364_15275 [Acidihalobacter yilgarnensis]
MITGFDQYRWLRLGGAVFIVLLFFVLVKPALASLAAIAQNGAPPSAHVHANALRRDRVTSHGEHTRASAVDRAVMEDNRALFEFTEPKSPYSVVSFGFLCFALLILLAASLSALMGRRLRDPIESDLGSKHSPLYLATLRLRI